MGAHMVNGRYVTTNEYIEGCWHMQRTSQEPLPAMPIGTGFEDFFDSGFGFSIIGPDPRNQSSQGYNDNTVIQRVCNGTVNPVANNLRSVCEKQGSLFHHETSGILHFSSDSSLQAVGHPALNLSSLG